MQNSLRYDVTAKLTNNVRGSDLRALVIKPIKTYNRLFALAGASKSTL